MDRPYIFGIGSGKTGGHSLAEALRRLGFSTQHIGNRCYHGDTFIRDTMLQNRANGDCPTDGIGGLDAIVDWPVHEMFRELDRGVPEAKFVLTYRPPDDCAISWCRMIAQQHRNVGEGWPKGYTEYADLVREHNDAVVRHFFGRPDKLLILDARDDSKTKWALLSKFFGLPAPNGEYPHEFNHADWEPAQ